MENITKIAGALLKAQMEMGDAKKDSINPFFKSKYADLNSVREACIPILNKYGIVALQPMVHKDGKNFINTILLHGESGELLQSFTEIVYGKIGDAQAQGSGITYARRYGLQSFVNIGCEDDDGQKASIQPTAKKPYLNEDSTEFTKALKFMNEGGSITDIEKKYFVSEAVAKLLTGNK